MKHLTKQAIKKALQSSCRYKVSAIGFDKKGNVIGTAVNTSRFNRYGGGIHAEQKLMFKYGNRLKTILICRVGNSGEIRKIDPCDKCQKAADKLGIKIISISE